MTPGLPQHPLPMSREYIELCQKLALPREWRHGDEFGTVELDRAYGPFLLWWTPPDPLNPERGFADRAPFWLPREGDWLEKFREERIPLTLRLMYDEHGEPFWFGIAPETKGLANHQEQGGDPALVLCRLYMAVKHLSALDALAQEGRG